MRAESDKVPWARRPQNATPLRRTRGRHRVALNGGRRNMKIGILGSGVVGQTLGGGFLKHGHQVALGTREPATLKAWATNNTGGEAKSFSDAAAFGEIVVLAVGGEVALDALRLAGEKHLSGKT